MIFPSPLLRPLSHRDQLGAILHGMGHTAPIVEVGTLYAGYTEKLLAGYPGQVHCVDPWVNQPESAYFDGANRFNMEEVYAHARRAVGSHPRCTLHRMMSLEGATRFADRSLAAVYLDGNHRLANIRQDIAAWFPKVQIGGIFSGHDFYIRYDNDTDSDAQTAVMEFAEKVGVWPHCNWCCSWYFVVTQEMADRFAA